jgi:hypothetical protein
LEVMNGVDVRWESAGKGEIQRCDGERAGGRGGLQGKGCGGQERWEKAAIGHSSSGSSSSTMPLLRMPVAGSCRRAAAAEGGGVADGAAVDRSARLDEAPSSGMFDPSRGEDCWRLAPMVCRP